MMRATDHAGVCRTRLKRARSASLALRPLWRNDRGVAAVEFAFVAPILILIVAGIVQFGAVFFLQGNMGNAAREVARSLAVGAVATQADAKKLAESKLTNWGVAFDVTVTFPDPSDPNDTDYTVTISAPLSEAAIFDILGVFKGNTLTAMASMREE